MLSTIAEAPMAQVPQMQIRSTAFNVLEPPAFAANIPEKAKNRIEKPYW